MGEIVFHAKFVKKRDHRGYHNRSATICSVAFSVDYLLIHRANLVNPHLPKKYFVLPLLEAPHSPRKSIDGPPQREIDWVQACQSGVLLEVLSKPNCYNIRM
eukprot:scaffold609_cov130-Cylindrotheca_fusiformis.AAC.21